MPGPTLEEYLKTIEICKTADDLLAAFRRELTRDGLSGITVTRLGPAGPTGAWNPLLALPPFAVAGREGDYGRDCAAEFELPAGSSLIAKFNLGGSAAVPPGDDPASGGYRARFHGPGGRCDVFQFNAPCARPLDAARLAAAEAKAYATWVRLTILEAGASADCDKPLSNPTLTLRKDEEPLRHIEEASGITEQQCRALLIADISYRRYKAGLIELNQKLPSVLGTGMLEALEAKGLVHEKADDEHWRYFTKPSALGRAHLASCPAAARWREEIWRNIVRRGEKPAV